MINSWQYFKFYMICSEALLLFSPDVAVILCQIFTCSCCHFNIISSIHSLYYTAPPAWPPQSSTQATYPWRMCTALLAPWGLARLLRSSRAQWRRYWERLSLLGARWKGNTLTTGLTPLTRGHWKCLWVQRGPRVWVGCVGRGVGRMPFLAYIRCKYSYRLLYKNLTCTHQLQPVTLAF